MPRKKLTLEQREIYRIRFIEKSSIKHNNKYDYSKFIYVNNDTDGIIICHKIEHGEFLQKPRKHLNRGDGCPTCSGNKKSNTQKFIRDAKNIHGELYKYNNSEYLGSNYDIIITCKTHGDFPQAAYYHLSGGGCPSCYGNKKSSTNEFIEKSQLIHENLYNYTYCDYINNYTDVIITCLKPGHGNFEQTPNYHLCGNGCPQCLIETYIINYINKANLIHNNFYNYENITYGKNGFKKIKIICPKHGQFKQDASSHLQGHGCPNCSTRISKAEIKWLNDIGLPNDKEHRNVCIKINNKNFFVDGFSSETNTIYEFYGDYWHGNPKKFQPDKYNERCKTTFGNLYKKTIEREQELLKNNYKLITIWEYDFKNGS